MDFQSFLGIIGGLMVIALFIYQNKFLGDNGRIPPANTPEGRRARSIGIILLVPMLFVAVLYTGDGGSIFSASNLSLWIITLSLAIIFIKFGSRK